jgi:hypothetical protein
MGDDRMHKTSRGVMLALWTATTAAAFGIGWITPPPYEPPGPDNLAAAIRSALGDGDALERLARTATLLERLEPENLPGVVAVYEQMIPLIDPRDQIAFFSAWARFDPAGALEYVLAVPGRERLDERRIGIRAVLAGWAYADPAKARAAVEEIVEANAPLRPDAWIGLVLGWVRSDQGAEGLSAFLADLRPQHQRDEAAEVAANELVRTHGADAALEWADLIVADDSQDRGFKRVVFDASVRAAAAFDPARTAAWVLTHADAEYAGDSLLIVAKRWARADGVAAMGWLDTFPAGESRDTWVREAVRTWFAADRESAQAWLESTSQTALRDPALEVWAEQLSFAWESVEALGWCERILDLARRQHCLAFGAGQWYARDAVAAEAWLQTSSLDEEVRSEVRKKGKKLGESRSGPRRPRRPNPGGGPG